jgi:hypothetical protein
VATYTYLTWARRPTVRRLTWVCGPEPALVGAVVAAHREGGTPDQAVTLFADGKPGTERGIWDLLLSYPQDGRRAVVHGAERLKSTSLVADLAAARGMDAAVTVFVSAEPGFATDGGELAPHLAALKAARDGQIIRCCAPSSAEARAALVASWWPGAGVSLGYDVLARCGSLQAAWQACDQATRAGLEPTPARVSLVCPQTPAGELADLLVAGERPRAAALAAAVPREAVGALLGLLDYRLGLAAEIGDHLRSGLTPREAAAAVRADRFVSGKVAPHARAYDARRVRRLRGVLAQADAAWRAGARAGVVEAVVALWT